MTWLLPLLLSTSPLIGPSKTAFDDQCAAVKKQRDGFDQHPRCELVRAIKNAELHRYVGTGVELDYLTIKTSAGWFVSPPLEILTNSSHTGHNDIGTIAAVDLKRMKVGDRDAYVVQIREDVVEWCCESKRERVDRKFKLYYTVACTDSECIMPDYGNEPPVLRELTWETSR